MESFTILDSGWYQQNMEWYYDYHDVSFIDENTGWMISRTYVNSAVLVYTSDFGVTWSVKSSFPSKTYLACWFIDNLTGYIAGSNGEINKTTNGGISWSLQTIPGGTVINMLYFVDNLKGWCIGSKNNLGIIARTTNGGSTWNQVYSGLNELNVIKFENENTGWVGGMRRILLRTTNEGANWDTIAQPLPVNQMILDISLPESNIGYFTDNAGYVLKTTDNGLNWDVDTLSNPLTSIFFLNAYTGWVTASVGGNDTISFYKTTNSGINWYVQNNSHTGYINKLHFLNENTGIGISYFGRIFKTSNGGGIISLTNNQMEIPQRYVLQQNYPNPFNPVTNIQFHIPNNNSKVKLIVIDITGKHIINLVDEELNAGVYEVDFSGTGYSSGVYFYRIEAEEPNGNKFVDSKKMVLLK